MSSYCAWRARKAATWVTSAVSVWRWEWVVKRYWIVWNNLNLESPNHRIPWGYPAANHTIRESNQMTSWIAIEAAARQIQAKDVLSLADRYLKLGRSIGHMGIVSGCGYHYPKNRIFAVLLPDVGWLDQLISTQWFHCGTFLALLPVFIIEVVVNQDLLLPLHTITFIHPASLSSCCHGLAIAMTFAVVNR